MSQRNGYCDQCFFQNQPMRGVCSCDLIFFLKEKENRIAASVKALDHLMSKMASFK